MYISDLFGHFIDELEYIVTVAGIAELALIALILRASRQNPSTPIEFAPGGIVIRYNQVVTEGFQSIAGHQRSHGLPVPCLLPTLDGCV